jgi:hypothetical protein
VVAKLGRALLDGNAGEPFRRIVLDGEARRENRFVENRAAQSGIRALDWRQLRSGTRMKPDADTFFVLGSGSSVEELSLGNFEEIGSNVSVGINNWPLHPFVPDFYCFESVPRVGDGKDIYRALGMLARADILDRRPPLLVLRPKLGEDRGIFESVPAVLRDNLFYYGRISPATRVVKHLEADIAHYFDRVACDQHSVLLDSGASVARMAVLGLLLGYRNITFVGVDLTGSSYFWEANPSYLDPRNVNGPVNNQRPGDHETLSKTTRPFSALEMIEALAQYVTGRLDGRVSVASDSSALSAVLPRHSWKSEEPNLA